MTKPGRSEPDPVAASEDEVEHEALYVRQEVFRDALAVFAVKDCRAVALKDHAVVVLDTNALLAPYSVGAKSLRKIGEVLKRLKSQGRLKVPGQVAREFAHQRPQHLERIYAKLIERLAYRFGDDKFPSLEPLDEYREMQRAAAAVQDPYQKYVDATKKLLTRMRDWTWNDPVSTLYGEIIEKNEICDPEFKRDEFHREWERRVRLQIPPGYKDAKKNTNAIGDLLIWKSILYLGSEVKKPLIFVTGETKADWWHRASGQPIYPRFELQQEYRHASEGAPFAMASLHEYIEMCGADAEIVQDVRSGEDQAQRAQQEELPNVVEDAAFFTTWVKNYLRAVYPSWLFRQGATFDLGAHPVDRESPRVGIEVRILRGNEQGWVENLARRVERVGSGQIIDRFLLVVRGIDSQRAARVFGHMKAINPNLPICVGFVSDVPTHGAAIAFVGDYLFDV